MLSIKIIQIGKTKDSFFLEAEQEFLKRLKSFAKIEQITLKEGNSSEVSKAMEEEGKAILSKIDRDSFVVALAIQGQQFSSEDFTKFIIQQKDFGHGKIAFIIGGPYGLAPEVLKTAKLKLSFSKMTFTHQMIRIFLLEQIYRAFTILTGKKYHY